MYLTLNNPYSTQEVVFGSLVKIVEVHEIIHNSTVSAILEFESDESTPSVPGKRINVTVWSGEEYPGFGEWTKTDLEEKITEIFS